MSNLGWTSLEQAKKLVEAGLDVKTADMSYTVASITIAEYKISCKPYTQLESYWFDFSIPCWSLGVLISMLPKEHFKKDVFYNIKLGINSLMYQYHDSEGYSFKKSPAFVDKTNLIGNVVDALIWCYRQGWIKKGE